jgi:hypothetical protein
VQQRPKAGFELLVEDRMIKEVSDRPIAAGPGGRTLMPDLIESIPLTLMTARAMHLIRIDECDPSPT